MVENPFIRPITSGLPSHFESQEKGGEHRLLYECHQKEHSEEEAENPELKPQKSRRESKQEASTSMSDAIVKSKMRYAKEARPQEYRRKKLSLANLESQTSPEEESDKTHVTNMPGPKSTPQEAEKDTANHPTIRKPTRHTQICITGQCK